MEFKDGMALEEWQGLLEGFFRTGASGCALRNLLMRSGTEGMARGIIRALATGQGEIDAQTLPGDRLFVSVVGGHSFTFFPRPEDAWEIFWNGTEEVVGTQPIQDLLCELVGGGETGSSTYDITLSVEAYFNDTLGGADCLCTAEKKAGAVRLSREVRSRGDVWNILLKNIRIMRELNEEDKI